MLLLLLLLVVGVVGVVVLGVVVVVRTRTCAGIEASTSSSWTTHLLTER